MTKDTRDRNKYFDKSSLEKYVTAYSAAVHDGLLSVSTDELDKAYSHLRYKRSVGNRLFVGGNGGSSSISDHLCCDFTKGVATDKSKGVQVISLCSNHALHSAIANDMGYDLTLSYQLKLNELTHQDAVLLISSSGNSPNIVQAANYALTKRALVIGMTGFDGGHLSKIATITLHVDSYNYGVVEDCHQALMHILAQYLYLND